MRVGMIPEGPVEWILAKLNLLPAPLIDTHMAFLMARIIMVATKIGAFDALKGGPKTAEQVAKACGTALPGTERVLNALVSFKYLRPHAQGYALAPVARKWLLKDSPDTLRWKLLFQFAEWEHTKNIDQLVIDGATPNLHHMMDAETWDNYQRGMKNLAHTVAGETAKRAPVPKGAARMLDIGGSHGLYSVELCRAHPGLTSVILDLPEAVKAAAPLLAEENMGDRVVHRAGDALKDDLGEGAWDVVFVSALMHHFSNAQNQDLSRRIARALKPGGLFLIQEQIRTGSRFEANRSDRRIGAFLDLYFAATSASGTWTVEEMQVWQSAAGLKTQPAIWSRMVPGIALVPAFKS